MDHYARTSVIVKDEPNSNATNVHNDMWSGVKVIEFNAVNEEHMIEIPRAGFLAWHLLWCLLFLGILVADRFKHRLTRLCSRPCWVYARSWIAFSVMFLDLVITSFLNPSVARFMVFVYVLLIRTQFI